MRSLAVAISIRTMPSTHSLYGEANEPPCNVLCATANSQTIVSIENVIILEKKISASSGKPIAGYVPVKLE